MIHPAIVVIASLNSARKSHTTNPFDPDSALDHLTHMSDSTGLIEVVLGNLTGHRHPPTPVQMEESEIQELAADIVEVDVNSFRAGLTESLIEVGTVSIETLVEAELAFDVVAPVHSAGDTHHPTAVDSGDLSGGSSDGARRR